MKNRRRRQSGFTVAELTVALMVASIVLAGVATICQALGRGQSAINAMGQNQMQIRYTAVRIPDLIRSARQVQLTARGSIAVWKADDDGDGQMDADELAYLMNNTAKGTIELLECSGSSDVFTAAQVQDETAADAIRAGGGARLGTLLSGCSNTVFQVQNNRLVTVSFHMTEETGSRDYQICASRRQWATDGI